MLMLLLMLLRLMARVPGRGVGVGKAQAGPALSLPRSNTAHSRQVADCQCQWVLAMPSGFSRPPLFRFSRCFLGFLGFRDAFWV